MHEKLPSMQRFNFISRNQIKKLAFEGKMFIAHVNVNEVSPNSAKGDNTVTYISLKMQCLLLCH